MSRFAPRRPSSATIIAFVALFIALGGTGYAAFSLPKNSVGTKQLKNGAVTTTKIKNRAVTASKINTSGLIVPNALNANSAGSATNATNATNANHATSADGLTPLPSGQSESGLFATSDGDSSGSGYIGLTIDYPRPLATPIADANIIDVTGASATHCPGPGQANPGYLCLYDKDTAGTTGTVFYSNDGSIFPVSAGKLGVVLYWNVGAGDAYVGGEWTVTAP